jgi:hypothetical protein
LAAASACVAACNGCLCGLRLASLGHLAMPEQLAPLKQHFSPVRVQPYPAAFSNQQQYAMLACICPSPGSAAKRLAIHQLTWQHLSASSNHTSVVHSAAVHLNRFMTLTHTHENKSYS